MLGVNIVALGVAADAHDAGLVALGAAIVFFWNRGEWPLVFWSCS